ncbi:MAG: protein kinase [Chloroflexota bacterium]
MSQPSWINRTLNNRYTIESLLGQGGMSAVYKATDPNLKRVVAVKLVHSHLATDPKFISRFEEEATAVAKLRHPNIVQVFDFNADEGVYYMVMEFIPGETLQERLRRLNKAGRRLSIEEAIKYTINICDAMGYAHKQGIVHRDIKPANIMLDVHNQAILMDFGIVKIVGGESHTATGAVVGTARYMSPEVIRAETPDQRSDIYSLGIALYEMLSGETPFNSDSAMTLMMMHLNDPVPDLKSVRPDVPPALVNVLNKSLEKNPARRYGSAAEMAADLKRVLADLEGMPAPAMQTQADATVNEGASPAMAANAPATMKSIKADRPAAPDSTGFASRTMNAPGYAPPERTAAYGNPPSQSYARPASSNTRLFILLGAGVAVLFLIGLFIVGALLFSNIGGAAAPATPSNTPQASQTAVNSALPVVVVNADTETPFPTDTLLPPPETPIPTNTFPPLYVQILGIAIDGSNRYVVEYQTYGYTETLPGMHIHFFFDTVPPEQAGVPGSGPWILYGGPRPFTGYSVGDRPSSAIQMCALVAYQNHSIILGSGNCFDLPGL